MIIFLFGPDSYRRRQKFFSLIKIYQEKYPQADRLFVDLESEPEDWIKVKDFLNQPSIFEPIKVVLIKEATKVNEKPWLQVLKKELRISQNFLLISDGNEPKKEFEFLTKKPSTFFSFPVLIGNLWESFLKKEAAGRSLKFSYSAWQWLKNVLDVQENNKTWTASNAFDKIKLVNFPQPISLENLKSLLFWSSREKIWLMAKKFWASHFWTERLAILEFLFLQKEEPAYIFNSLAYQQTSSSKIQILADYDISIKSGHLDYEEALLDLAIK